MKKHACALILTATLLLTAASPIPAEEPSTEAITEEIGKALAAHDINVREQDSESSLVIGVVSEGEAVNVISSGEYWTHITYPVSEDTLLDGYARTELLDFDYVETEDLETENEEETETETELPPLTSNEAISYFNVYRKDGKVERSITKEIVGDTDCSVAEIILATVKIDLECLGSDFDGDAYRFLIKGNYTLNDEYGMFKEQKRFDAVYEIDMYSRNGKLVDFEVVD